MNNLKPAPGFKKHPTYQFKINPAKKGFELTFSGVLIARSSSAMLMEEGKYPGRLYFPKSGIFERFLSANDTITYCPFKGDARYWDISAGGTSLTNAAWTYEDPYREFASIQGYICFYTEKGPFEYSEFEDVA